MSGALVLEIIVSLLLVAGGVFGLIGSLGLVKLGHPMTRLHAPTKASTLGVGGVLIASMIWRGGSWQELAITLFLFATAPVSALFLARVWLVREARKREIPREWRDRP